MKSTYSLLLLSIFSLPIFSQEKIQYYNHKRVECDSSEASYYVISNTKDPLNVYKCYYYSSDVLEMTVFRTKKSIYDNYITTYHPNGNINTIGSYVNNKEHNEWQMFYENGNVRSRSKYINGKQVGILKKWHRNGRLSDSVFFYDDSIYTKSWFENGNISSIGYYFQDADKFGDWIYYHKNGKVSAKVTYNKSGSITSAEYFDTKGKKNTKISLINVESSFVGGEEKWNAYLNKNTKKYKKPLPKNLKKGVVLIGFYIDELGKTTDIEVVIPLSNYFDNAAINIIKNSPKWHPEISMNRKIRKYRTQAVIFE